MIDIHCHVLPGFDDGPVSLDESIEMARLADRDGISHLIATPHSAHLIGKKYGEPEIRAAVETLRTHLSGRGIAVEALPGIEAHIGPDIERELQERSVITLNSSRYLLLELPFSMFPLFAEQVIVDLRLRGQVPILAHPERLEYFQKNPNLVGRMIRFGALAQITADSLIGGFGPRARVASEIMLEHQMVHFLASDAHDARYRTPVLAQSRQAAARLIGEEGARRLVEDNPLAVIENREIAETEPERYVASRRWLW